MVEAFLKLQKLLRSACYKFRSVATDYYKITLKKNQASPYPTAFITVRPLSIRNSRALPTSISFFLDFVQSSFMLLGK